MVPKPYLSHICGRILGAVTRGPLRWWVAQGGPGSWRTDNLRFCQLRDSRWGITTTPRLPARKKSLCGPVWSLGNAQTLPLPRPLQQRVRRPPRPHQWRVQRPPRPHQWRVQRPPRPHQWRDHQDLWKEQRVTSVLLGFSAASRGRLTGACCCCPRVAQPFIDCWRAALLPTAWVSECYQSLTAHQHQKGHTVPKQVITIATLIQVTTVQALHCVRAFAIRPSLNKMFDKTWYPGCATGWLLSAPPDGSESGTETSWLRTATDMATWAGVGSAGTTACHWDIPLPVAGRASFSNWEGNPYPYTGGSFGPL